MTCRKSTPTPNCPTKNKTAKTPVSGVFFMRKTALPERNAALLRPPPRENRRKWIFPVYFLPQIYISHLFFEGNIYFAHIFSGAEIFSALRGHSIRAGQSYPCGAGLHANGRGAVPVLVCSFAGGADLHALKKLSAHDARIQMRRAPPLSEDGAAFAVRENFPRAEGRFFFCRFYP